MVPVMSKRSFILGEEKKISFRITSHDKTTVVVTSASYELLRGNEVISRGQCTVDQDRVSLLLCPTERGHFILEVTFNVPRESRKCKVMVDVT